MRTWQFGLVTVDGQPAASQSFLGKPTENAADDIAFVHVPYSGDYIFDFGNEPLFREVQAGEFIRLPAGVWFIRSVRDGDWQKPLPMIHDNQYRFFAHGHLLTIQF
jgi:hypothetical protein